jgi:5-methyltetrahydrofolate--homocysteine methyltransferase
VKAWIEAHEFFHSLYRKVLPGDCSWLLWAPGKTYACQCDFSTMISPGMFKEFVVPEIKEVGQYLDYIIWHLDGPDEIRHLDILLGIPEIKAIQVVPGAGRPPCASPLWIPQMKKIQEKGKLVYAFAETREELKILVQELSPEKLLISCADFFSTDEEIEEFFGKTH